MRKNIFLTATLALTSAFSPCVIFGTTNSVNDIPSTIAADDFVSREGNNFMLDGKPFYYVGSNNYYLNFYGKNEVDAVIEDAADMGLKVLRTWGNIDAGTDTGTKTDWGWTIFEDSVDGAGEKDGVYYQYFDASLNRPVVNEGEYGLEYLDYALYKAAQEDIKLIITFTNNWKEFGGMEQYIKWGQLAGLDVSEHDDFYTNETIKEWYKDYINTLLNHTNVYTGIKYKDDPAVFAWELANEPRATSDPQCTKGILTDWASEMSSYVKSIDTNHMVAVGDEGFFNYSYNEFPEGNYGYVFHGGPGVDWKELINLETIDFGTVHLYPNSWGLSTEQTDLYLKQHALVASEANKPVVLEEYGWNNRSDRDSVYSRWFDILEGNTYPGLSYNGSNYWMIASITSDNTLYTDYDGFTVYYRSDANGNPTQSTADLISAYAARMNAKSSGVEVSTPSPTPTNTPVCNTQAPTPTPTSTPDSTQSPSPTPTSTPVNTQSPSSTPTSEPSTNDAISLSVSTNASGSINQTYTLTALQAVDLSEVAIRYYFSKSDNKAMNFWCDNAGAQLNCAPWYLNLTPSVVGTFGQDDLGHYLEITFNESYELVPGTGSLTLQTRFANEDWSAISSFEEGQIVCITK